MILFTRVSTFLPERNIKVCKKCHDIYSSSHQDISPKPQSSDLWDTISTVYILSDFSHQTRSLDLLQQENRPPAIATPSSIHPSMYVWEALPRLLSSHPPPLALRKTEAFSSQSRVSLVCPRISMQKNEKNNNKKNSSWLIFIQKSRGSTVSLY